ncbi:jg13004 [Pararge aegeria aegeria]|uniref:Jg13004 protein n=1 Tax=Pararge aegeria aegeria TaxID=348720 RepID=A0A8S4R2A6_9NEOP|nr:jg13004 [Pararge aegeria aegeria]
MSPQSSAVNGWLPAVVRAIARSETSWDAVVSFCEDVTTLSRSATGELGAGGLHKTAAYPHKEDLRAIDAGSFTACGRYVLVLEGAICVLCAPLANEGAQNAGNKLLHKMANLHFDVHGYADDLVVTVRGVCQDTLSHLMQRALNTIEKWCIENELTVNADKTVIIPFHRKRKIDNLKPPKLYNVSIPFHKTTQVTTQNKLYLSI